jgi:hypothetical protein
LNLDCVERLHDHVAGFVVQFLAKDRGIPIKILGKLLDGKWLGDHASAISE